MTVILSRLLLTGALAGAAAIAAPASAQSTRLTFDALNRQYGDGPSLGANMTGDGRYLAYTENGYTLTLQTTNAVGSGRAHIGDGTGTDNTFNWHDDGDNQLDAYVVLTKADGGLFNLASFDYLSQGGTSLTVAAGTYAPLIYKSNTSGSATPNFNGVSSVRFASTGYNQNQLDNLVVSAAAVPEPASWAMMILGVGATGFAMRRRQKTTTRVSYAA